METTDRIRKAFRGFCDGGPFYLSKEDRGYLLHVVNRCRTRGSHPLIALMALECYSMPGMVAAFLEFATKEEHNGTGTEQAS